MLRNDTFSIVFVTLYVFIYCVLLQFESTLSFAIGMLLFSPFLIFWMVYTILKYGKYNGKGLGDDEFGYQDKNKDELGVF
ncbi:MAG: hypothetical protein Q7W13_19065 [Bacteroidia bacterium]|nr:hypothetical protein [Bacteroidia bacterium]